MTNKIFFDTNVILYAFTERAGSHLDSRIETAEELLAAGGLVSVQVLNEFADVASRKLKFSWVQIELALDEIETLCGRALPLTVEMHRAALGYSRNYGFRIYDSLILAAAQQAGCNILYSEDMQHGQQIGSMKIVNPFLVEKKT
jgi:predicted nucleic acid-binding protein